MGRSRGGLTTKIHALVDAFGLPIGLKLTEGQAHDGRAAADMLDDLGQGCILLADRAYDSDGMRAALAARGAWACVKPMPNRKRDRPPPSGPGGLLVCKSENALKQVRGAVGSPAIFWQIVRVGLPHSRYIS